MHCLLNFEDFIGAMMSSWVPRRLMMMSTSGWTGFNLPSCNGGSWVLVSAYMDTMTLERDL